MMRYELAHGGVPTGRRAMAARHGDGTSLATNSVRGVSTAVLGSAYESDAETVGGRYSAWNKPPTGRYTRKVGVGGASYTSGYDTDTTSVMTGYTGASGASGSRSNFSSVSSGVSGGSDYRSTLSGSWVARSEESYSKPGIHKQWTRAEKAKRRDYEQRVQSHDRRRPEEKRQRGAF